MRMRDDVAWLRGADVGLADDVVFVAALPDGPPVVLNGVSARIWEGLAEGASVAELVAALSEETDTDAEVVRRDLEPFLVSLAEHGLIGDW